MGAQKRKALLESPGLEVRSQGLNFLSLGLKTQIGELEAHAAFRQTQKKDPSCTLAKPESAVHSSLYRSARKNVCAARNGQPRAAFAPKICKTNFLNSLKSNSFVGKDAHFACFYHLKQNFFHSTRNDLPSPAPLPHHKKALLLHKVRLHLSNAKENPSAFPLPLHSVCTTFAFPFRTIRNQALGIQHPAGPGVATKAS